MSDEMSNIQKHTRTIGKSCNRAPQNQMMAFILEHTIDPDPCVMCIEAPTGTGKTWGAFAPLIRLIETRTKLLVVVSSKILQVTTRNEYVDWLNRLKMDKTVSILFGKNTYYCRDMINAHWRKHGLDVPEGAEWQALVEDNAARGNPKEALEDFVKKQVSKLQASELHLKDDIKLKLDPIVSKCDSIMCNKCKCGGDQKCKFWNIHREDIMTANIVVANYHAICSYSKTRVPCELKGRVVIFDEGHEYEGIIKSIFTEDNPLFPKTLPTNTTRSLFHGKVGPQKKRPLHLFPKDEKKKHLVSVQEAMTKDAKRHLIDVTRSLNDLTEAKLKKMCNSTQSQDDWENTVKIASDVVKYAADTNQLMHRIRKEMLEDDSDESKARALITELIGLEGDATGTPYSVTKKPPQAPKGLIETNRIPRESTAPPSSECQCALERLMVMERDLGVRLVDIICASMVNFRQIMSVFIKEQWQDAIDRMNRIMGKDDNFEDWYGVLKLDEKLEADEKLESDEVLVTRYPSPSKVLEKCHDVIQKFDPYKLIVMSATLRSGVSWTEVDATFKYGNFPMHHKNIPVTFKPEQSSIYVSDWIHIPDQWDTGPAKRNRDGTMRTKQERMQSLELLRRVAHGNAYGTVVVAFKNSMLEIAENHLRASDIKFTRNVNEHRETVDQGRRCVLIASKKLTTGLDLKGKYCTAVVMLNLHFPYDSVFKIYCKHCLTDETIFTNACVKEQVISTRQTVGRLIRDRNDRGVVFVIENGRGAFEKQHYPNWFKEHKMHPEMKDAMEALADSNYAL